MKSFLTSIAFFAAGALAQAPPVTITQPLLAFNWTTCTSQIISWVNPVGPTISQIYLDQGPSTLLQKILLVAKDVPTGPMSYQWTPPSTIQTGQYSLELGTPPNIAYAGPFQIINSGATCGDTPPAGSVASGSAAPASASAAVSSAAPANASSAASFAPSAASVTASSAASVASVASVASATSVANIAGSSAAASASASTSTSSAVRPSSVSSMALVATLSLIAAVAALL